MNALRIVLALLVLVCVFAGTADAGIFGRGGGQMGMVCNQAPGPVQATATNLVQAPATAIVTPLACGKCALVPSRLGIDLNALQALNINRVTTVNMAHLAGK